LADDNLQKPVGSGLELVVASYQGLRESSLLNLVIQGVIGLPNI
jgi:hypothetical protein